MWVLENPDEYDERDVIDAKRYTNAYIEGYNQALLMAPVVGQSEQLVCDVCGSDDVIEAPHMGRNCNRCHPL